MSQVFFQTVLITLAMIMDDHQKYSTILKPLPVGIYFSSYIPADILGDSTNLLDAKAYIVHVSHDTAILSVQMEQSDLVPRED